MASLPRFVSAVVHEGPPSPESWLLLTRGLEVVMHVEGDGLAVPTVASLEPLRGAVERLHFLGWLDGRACFTAPLPESVPLPTSHRQVAARTLFGLVDEVTLQVAGRALAVSEWALTHRYCGRCGEPTVLEGAERAFRCPGCRTPYYPRVAPAIIVLVERGEQVLLARAAAFPRPWFSTLAGFVEPGESLEECVHREVKEEVGIELAGLRYFGSQPWPYGRSLMVAFFARHQAGEVKVDGHEILEAHWYERDTLPMIPPKISIARKLIDAWLARAPGAGGGR